MARWYTETPEQRLWKHLKLSDDCWIWTGSVDGMGYGRIGTELLGYCRMRLEGAHRVSYRWLFGPIPKDLDLDHVCEVKRCVNPFHLEPVTHSENMLRYYRGRIRK